MNVFKQETESESTEEKKKMFLERSNIHSIHTSDRFRKPLYFEEINTQTPPSDKRAGLNGRWQRTGETRTLEIQGGANR